MKLPSLEEIIDEVERFNSNLDRPKHLDREAIRIIEKTNYKITIKKIGDK